MTETTDSTRTAGKQSRAANLKQRLREDGKQKIESGKRGAADQIAEIADAIGAAGAQLDQSQPTLAGYATRLADSVGGLATHLREDSIEDLYYQVRRLATQHPGMFLLGSAAVGVVIARFMKASAEQELEASEGSYAEASYGEASYEGSGGDLGQTSLDQAGEQQSGAFYRTSATPDNPDTYGARET